MAAVLHDPATTERLHVLGLEPLDLGGNEMRHFVLFNRVTNVAEGRNGDLYISDSYGNARVHRFSPDGKYLASWGQPGYRPGQFNLPHGIAVGCLFLGIGARALWQAPRPLGSLTSMGPGFFPTLLATGLVLAGALSMLGGTLAARRAAIDAMPWRSLGFVLGGVVGAGLLLTG